jgi:hypothetical protein
MTLRPGPFEPTARQSTESEGAAPVSPSAAATTAAEGQVDDGAAARSVSQEPEPPDRALVAFVLACAVAVGFLGYYGLLCVRPEWGGDFQMYCAGIARLYRDMRHPLHESLNVPGSQSTVYTPYLVGIAVLGRLSGITPFHALQVAGFFNLLLFLLGAGYLFSRVSIHRRWWLSAACFIFAMLCLRWLHIGWSSEMSLTNLQYIQPIPSTFAWALALFAFGLMVEVAKRRRWQQYVALIGVLGLTLSSHVLTGSWVGGVVVMYGLWRSLFERSPKPLAAAIGAVVVGLLVVLPWPYASFLQQGSLQTVKEGAPFGSSPFVEFPNLYALGMVGFLYGGLRLRRHGFWLLGLVGTLGALVVWRWLGVSYGDRYALFATFFPQLIVGEVMALGVYALLGPLPELAPARRWPWLDRPLCVAFLIASCVSWLPSPMMARARQKDDWGTLRSLRAVLRRPSPHDAYYHQFDDVKAFLTPDDVVMTPVTRVVLDLASVTGASSVSTPLTLRVPDNNRRFRDVARFFRGNTRREDRMALARKYQVTKVLVQSRRRDLVAQMERDLGPPLASGDSYTLFALNGE